MTPNRHVQIGNPIRRYWINRKYKDRLFRRIFKKKKDLLQLYNAINNTAYTNPEDLIITTLEDTIILSMKNDLSFIISSSMNLYEHQSTFNPNMPIRVVFYFSRLYEMYIALHELNIYDSALIKLPTPQYVIFYNGDADKPDRMILKLSDAFQLPETENEVIPALECTAVMLNINYGHNEELLNKCKPLRDYSIFTTKIKNYKHTGMTLEDAVDRAIDECIEEDVLVDILFKHRTLAKNSILTEYSEKKQRKLDLQSGFEHGLECGIERGIEQTLQVIVSKKIRKKMTLDMIANDLEEDIEVIRPIYEKVKQEMKTSKENRT